MILKVKLPTSYEIQLRHLVLDGSSNWVIGRNITKHSNIIHMNKNVLQVPCSGQKMVSLPLVDHDLHSYLPITLFISQSVDSRGSNKNNSSSSSQKVETKNTSDINTAVGEAQKKNSNVKSGIINGKSATMSWKDMKKIADKVHRHVCGHCNFSDVKMLLQRNKLLTPEVEKYLLEVMKQCNACRSTAKPQVSRKVSLSSLHRSFTEVVCVDHLFLDDLCIFHIMDSRTRYSAGLVCPDTTLKNSVFASTTTWLSPFWSPSSVRGDQAFNHTEFTNFISSIGATFGPIPPRRHQKNVIESKHGIIRSIFIRLKADKPDMDASTLVQQSFLISNNLYGSDIMSAYEMAHGFPRPLNGIVHEIDDEIIDAQNTLEAKRKLTTILRTKSTQDSVISHGDLVELFIKTGKEKR